MVEIEWDKSKNTHTNEELKEILAQHKLWLDTKGKEGEKADLSGAVLMRADLEGANLMRADLEGANLMGAYLEGADLRGANLMRANLMRANLEGANLEGANLKGADLMRANLRGARFEKDQLKNTINRRRAIGVSPELITLQPTELQEKQNQIQRLEQELQQAQREVEKGKENTGQIQKLQDELSQVKQERDNLEKQLKTTLDTHIKNAQKALKKSLKSADKRINEYSLTARIVGISGIILIAIDLGVIICLGFHYELFFNSLEKFKEFGAWALTLYSFPILIVFSIAVTLLRHQKKLLDEVRHYSSEKRQIELYSGLLKASQYSAKSLNDPEQSAKYVHETFDKIRDRILSEQSYTNTAGSAVEKEDYVNLEALLTVLATIANKNEMKK